MNYARDFRQWGREALKGNWLTAVLVCLVGGLLGGGVDLISGVMNSGSAGTTLAEELSVSAMWPMLVTVTSVSGLVALLIGGAVTLGMNHFFINLAAHRPALFENLFSRFTIWGKGIWMSIVVAFFVLLWSLIGIIPASTLIVATALADLPESGSMLILLPILAIMMLPGIIASYRYAMVPYLIAEFPELSVMDAMEESKRLMRGNKWRLFCLNFSFFGWIILVVLFTLGIGNLWLSPYIRAANAAFYLDITGRKGLRYPGTEQTL